LGVKIDYTPNKSGIYVSGVYSEQSDLEQKDIITSVNGHELGNMSMEKMYEKFAKILKDAREANQEFVTFEVHKGIQESAKPKDDDSSNFLKKALPLPPKEKIRMVLWDMDNTLLGKHTRGVWFAEIGEEICSLVTTTFVSLVPSLIEKGFQVGVVTFSDAEVAKVYKEVEHKEGKGGPDLVIPIVSGALTMRYEKEGMDVKEAAKKAKNLVDQMYIVGALPDYRNSTEAHEKVKMPMSKYWHIEQVKDMHVKRTKEARIKNDEILFFDDSPPNVKAARKSGVHAFWVNPRDAFTENDWRQAMESLED